MSEQQPIPADPGATADVSPQVLAVLTELADMLEALLAGGQAASVDVRSLPLLPGDYERLRGTLGTGEVTATVDALGRSSIQETAVPGIWWVTHRNSSDDVVAELIEVSPVPELLQAQPEDLREGPARLRARRASLTNIDA